jgi:hypothetical protein
LSLLRARAIHVELNPIEAVDCPGTKIVARRGLSARAVTTAPFDRI